MKQNDFPKQKTVFALMVFALFFVGMFKMHAQGPPPGIALFWDSQVGCQVGMEDDKRTKFLEDIEESDCLRVCDQSQVNYQLFYLPTGAVVTWNVAGGTILTTTSDGCKVRWENVGTGSITMNVVLPESSITKTMCIEKIELPTALFKIPPQPQPDHFVTCSEQVINFTNLSYPNTGSSLIRYFWDFGDNTFSSAFEPTHTYAHEGEYTVTLTVTNACNCTSSFRMKVIAKRRGFEILCPTVVCEGQSAVYSLPQEAVDACQEKYNWSVIGGEIISQGGGSIEVLWNHVDELGFGYVTFDPKDCNLPCLEPSTVKVPIIKARGTITGTSALCIKEQARYKLPQWPTTDIQWEIIDNDNNNLAVIMPTDQRNEIIVMPLTSGVLTLKAIYTNTLLGCSGYAEFQIHVAAPLEIIGENNFCLNSSGIFTNSENAPVNWTLSDPSGTVVATGIDATFSHVFSLAGKYTLAVESPNFCSVDSKNIVVLAIPESPSGLDGEIVVCPGSTYAYSVQNPDPNSTYLWEVANGTVLGSQQGEEVNIVFNGTFPATIKVFRKTISPIECISAPLIITVNKVQVKAGISSPSSEVCSSSYASYNAVYSGTNTLFTEGESYSWTISNPALGSVTDGQGTNQVKVLWNDVTVETSVTLILTIGKCTLSPAPKFTKKIVIYPKTEIKIVASENPVCSGPLYTVTYTVVSANGLPLSPSDVVTWNFGNGNSNTPAGVFINSKTYVNNGSTNIDMPVTAFIANSRCGATNTAAFTSTVVPNPPAIVTLTSGGNVYCTATEVNSVLTVSSNTIGVLLQWYKNGAIIPGQTSTSLNVNSTLNFGTYTFRAVNPNGCVAVSNPIVISQQCGGGSAPDCTITGVLQNNAKLTSCGTITLTGTATPAPISSEWKVIGTGSGNYTVNGNTLTGVPGMYTIIYEAAYACAEGGIGKIRVTKQVIIPYAPDFSFLTSCNIDNTFNVNFIDNSNFYAGVTSPQVRFYYKTTGAATFTGPVAYNSSLSVFEMQNLPAGSYVFKVENSGITADTDTYVCSKEYTANLQGVNASTSIVVNNTECDYLPVFFSLNPIPPAGTTVKWDFGDGAQNTLMNPERVFPTPGSLNTVTCTITNAYGCSKTVIANPKVYVPKKCFFGEVKATPSNATVCKGQTVLLTYVPHNDNCSVASYTWMDDNSEVPNAGNSSTLYVDSPGSYWVKVRSSDGCEYSTARRITPTFKPLPSVKIKGQSRYCENDPIILTAVTDATNIQWAIDGGSPLTQFNNMKEADLSGMFSAYTFVITCTVTKDGCSNTASHTIVVEESIQDILVDYIVHCNPYLIEITAQAITYSGATAHYNWSNGDVGETITVSDGGVFSVTASTGGGCSLTKQIDLPKNPENYMWVFPTGCYSDCSRVGNYLIGPLLPMNGWSWNNGGQPVSSGSGSVTPFPLSSSGDYSLTINTGNCSLESDVLSFTVGKCEKCKIEHVDIKEVVKNDTKYCSFTQELVIYSAYSGPFQVTLTDQANNVVIIPSTFTLVPGQNIIQVIVIPQSPFMGGNTTWRLYGQIYDKEVVINCEHMFNIDIPSCESPVYSRPIAVNAENTGSSTLKTCTLYPNPASGTVQLQYDLDVSGTKVELYELTGRLLIQQTLDGSQGTAILNINSYAEGMYVVVIKNGSQILYQQKLMIKQ